MMANVDDDQRLRDVQRQYVDLLDDNDVMAERVRKLMEAAKDGTTLSNRLIVSIDEIRAKNPARAKNLMVESFDEMRAFELALREYIGSVDADFAKGAGREGFKVGVEGSFGSGHLNPRTLTSSSLNRMVCVEGIVTRCSLVQPKVTHSVHYCPTTDKRTERTYSDLTSYEAFPSSAAYPTHDEEGNALQTEYGLSAFKNHQTLSIQELPETAPTGQLPRSVEAICEYDLVDICKPGDRVQIVGSYRCLPGKQGGVTSATFRAVLIANNIVLHSQEKQVALTEDDMQKCKNVCKQTKNIVDVLARSLAPSIHGHEYVKKALLCMLLGGVEKVLPNGSRLRGDINVLLIGDPSVAKSQLLRYVLATAPCAVAATGRGSSGVGLTAAVTHDQDTGDRRLEAGAMVLADRGVVCIDEFDKMSDIDRTAIHEVMEQGRVTISKAGIHARLNARCSVLAAANPVYGRYDIYKTPMENIGLQDSLLSRFDLLFVLLDTIDADSDTKISDHVIRIHRYRSPHEQAGAASTTAASMSDLATGFKRKKDATVWDKYEGLVPGSSKKQDKLLSIDFVKKYVEVAKCLKPVLTTEASKILGEEYSRLRSQDWTTPDNARTQPITARTLETLIRLSSAHAKARLSNTITKDDAEAAIDLVQYACFKKVATRVKKRTRETDEHTDEESETETEEARPTEAPKRAKTTHADHEETPVGSEDIADFKSKLFVLFESKGQESLPLDTIVAEMAAKSIDKKTVMKCIDVMTNENKVMLSAGVLYLI